MRYQKLREMAYTHQIAISIMVGAEGPINDHLIKLFVLTDQDMPRRHWVNEIIAYYERIEDIRLKPYNKLPLVNLFLDCLFANHFTPDGERPIKRIMARLSRQYQRQIRVDAADVLQRLTEFHHKCCDILAKGESPEPLILSLE